MFTCHIPWFRYGASKRQSKYGSKKRLAICSHPACHKSSLFPTLSLAKLASPAPLARSLQPYQPEVSISGPHGHNFIPAMQLWNQSYVRLFNREVNYGVSPDVLSCHRLLRVLPSAIPLATCVRA